MAYRGWWVAVAGAVSLAACTRDTGILVSVTRDPASVAAVDHLLFVIGAEGAQPGVFWKRAADPDVAVDVSGRDLVKRPFQLLLHDAPVAGTPPVALMVAVLGLDNGAPVAFAAFDAPQPFARELILQRDLMLVAKTAGKDFKQVGNCLLYGANKIVSPDDPDCDGDPPSDCDDTDGGPLPDGCAGRECDDDSQCPGLRGAPMCAGGSWKCIAGVCTQKCGACLDTDPPRDCYAGPSNTLAVGVCRGGKQWCAGGAWGPCIGQVIPSPEACNGQDDDCNGLTDDGLGTFSCGIGACEATVPACHQGNLQTCTPGTPGAKDLCTGKDDNCDGTIDEGCGCVKVAPTGNDSMAAANNNATPFATLGAAVTWASAVGTRPHVVCVASGATCTGAAQVYNAVTLTMANGIDVYGGYDSTNWTRCAGALTALRMGTPEGVVFPATVVTTTVLDGFSIERFVPPAGAQKVAGVSVLGAKNVILANLAITDGPTAPTTYAVDASGGAQVEIVRSSLVGGNGALLAAAVHALGSRVDVRQNCNSYDTGGACTAVCASSGTGGVLIGRSGPGGSASYAVLLDGAAGSTVSQSALCGVGSNASAALRVQGDGRGIVIYQNSIAESGGVADAHGLWLEDCLDAAPWIVDNTSISTGGATGSTRADGIRAFGACHPVIDSNRLIVGGGESNAASANGVHCGATANGASRCTVLGADKQVINGSSGGFPPGATGVRCDDGACLRVERNQISGHTAVDAVGLALSHAFTFVDRNQITGGCGTSSTIAVDADDSAARLQSNRIYAGTCGNVGTTTSTLFIGLRARLTASGNQLDVHSNDLDGAGDQLSCVSVGVLLESASPTPAGNVGSFRNNIVRAGMCPSRFGFKEKDATADVRVLDHNDFDPSGAPTALFVDEGTTALNDAAGINGLTDAQPGGNLSGDASFVNYPIDLHLGPSSICIGAGSTVDVPIYDLDGRTRKSPPAIGAYESN